ncbi:MAG: DUF4249 domain-containing protein [Bacteroidota bacterium]
MKTNNISRNLKKKSILVSAMALLFLGSCTERIDIDLEESYTRLVVEGIVTTDTLAHTIRLSTTTSYYYAEQAPPVRGAAVSFDDGISVTPLTETEPGIYQTSPDYHGIPGRTYTLNISLASAINGHETYTAVSQMNPKLTLDSINSTYHDDWGPDGYYEIRCYVLDPPTTDFYMFRVFKNGILISDSLNKVLVTDDRFYNGNYTNGVGIGFLNQSFEKEIVTPGDILTIESARITEEYYRFISQLQIQTGYQNPLFSGPPANISGNISNGGIGFFATYPVSYSKTIASGIKSGR